MKRFLITPILAAMIAIGTEAGAQEPEEYLGLPGDNFNLYAAMKLFQESETLESFERSLNDENTRINNLDLNNDNYIDYLKVIDYPDGDVHNIVLQSVLDRNESQDVAVFTVQRLRDGSVQIQVTGDEALYGRNYIIEPIYDETPNPGYLGQSDRQNVTVVRTTYVEVAAWPIVRFIYLPNYVMWRSSWYWGYYPSYWRPWRPYYWHYYYGYHYNWHPQYYGYYRRWDSHRYERWNDFYYSGRRVYSSNVSRKINTGEYRTTYSRPEQRKEGEALYARTNPGRTTRQSVSSSGTNATRRSSVSQGTTTRQQTGTSTTTRRSSTTNTGTAGTTRQSNTSVNERNRTNTSAGQAGTVNRQSSSTVNKTRSNTSAGEGTTTTRQSSSSTVNQRSGNGASAGQGTATGRQSGTVANKQSRTTSSASQNSSTARRSTPSVTQRSSSGSSSSQRASTSGNSRQPAASSGSSSRRSGGSSKSESSARKSSSSKDSESKSSRRN